MKTLETYKGFRLRVASLPIHGKWGYEYNVDHFPKFGRGFRTRLRNPVFSSERDAVQAGLEDAKHEIETFASISKIEAAVD
jgi:hypothetical protein